MKINGVELESLDILDLKVAEKYQPALKGVDDMGERVKGLTIVESIMLQCNTIFKIFNDLLVKAQIRKFLETRLI
nr:DUF6673 family protein [Clostridium culturomicium]